MSLTGVGVCEVLMFLGVLQIELAIPGSRSLKDKRRVVKSLKDRLHRDHLVSVAETAALDLPATAILGVAFVSNSKGRVSAVLDRVLRKCESAPGGRLVDYQRDVMRPSDVADEVFVEEDFAGGGAG